MKKRKFHQDAEVLLDIESRELRGFKERAERAMVQIYRRWGLFWFKTYSYRWCRRCMNGTLSVEVEMGNGFP